MALPVTGAQIGISQINTEMGLSANAANSSLNARGVSYGLVSSGALTRQSVDFGGQSYGDTITAGWGGVSTPSATSTTYSQYRSWTFSGISSGTTIRPRITVGLTAVSSGSIYYDWSLNSTSSWTQSAFFNSVTSASYYIPPTLYVGNTDTLRVRIRITKSASGGVSWSSTILSQYQLGTGSVTSYTASGTTVWTGSF